MEKNKATIISIFFITFIFLVFILCLYVYEDNLKDSPLELPYDNKVQITYFLPEAWGFFTRNPREAKFYIYKKKGAKWVNINAGPSMQLKYLFGLNRKGRSQGTEYAYLLKQLKPIEWISCRTLHISKCFTNNSMLDTVKSITPHPTICGKIVIQKRKTVPWAWANSEDKIIMPSKNIKLFVRCS